MLIFLLVGGPVLFIAAQGWYLWAILKVRSRRHVFGLVALGLIGFATLAVPAYVALLLVEAVLTFLAGIYPWAERQKS